MTQLRLRSSFFHEHGFSSGALGFHECGSGSGVFFHGSDYSSDFCSFPHINIWIVFVWLKLNGKWIKSSTRNIENIPNFFERFSQVFCYKQPSCNEEVSERTTITGSGDWEISNGTSRNISQDNGNINLSNKWRYFEAQTPPEPEITSPNPARDLFLKPGLGPKAEFTEWIKICAIVGHQKMLCTGIAGGNGFITTKIANTLTVSQR